MQPVPPKPRLSLTFDNGPTPGITDRVLDCLNDFDVRATFFLVGKQLESPEGKALLERTLALGHRVGNHSYHHGPPLGAEDCVTSAAEEILRTHALLGAAAGPSPLYRPNGRGRTGSHLLNREAVDTITALDGTVVLWNSVPKDRAAVVTRPDLWVEEAQSHIQRREWTLMVLHDRPSGFDLPGPMAFLPAFLRWAKDNVEFRSDFPMELTPIYQGQARPNLEHYVCDFND